MRSFFSGNRRSQPLGPPQGHDEPPKEETLQAVRQRQRDRQRKFVMQMMKAEKERDVAHDSGDSERAGVAEAQRRQMSDAADALAQQIMIIERIMEEFGLVLDLEEEAKADREMLEERQNIYNRHLVQDSSAIAENYDRVEATKPTGPEYMMPADVYDEDKAMRDVDEIAQQTGRV